MALRQSLVTPALFALARRINGLGAGFRLEPPDRFGHLEATGQQADQPFIDLIDPVAQG